MRVPDRTSHPYRPRSGALLVVAAPASSHGGVNSQGSARRRSPLLGDHVSEQLEWPVVGAGGSASPSPLTAGVPVPCASDGDVMAPGPPKATGKVGQEAAVHDPLDRVGEHSATSLPSRPPRVPVPGDHEPGPHRPRPQRVDQPVKGRLERLQRHLRRQSHHGAYVTTGQESYADRSLVDKGRY